MNTAIAHASTLPPPAPTGFEIHPPASGEFLTPRFLLELRADNAEGLLTSALQEIDRLRVLLEDAHRAIAKAQTEERAFCIGLCEAEVAACENLGDPAGADGARSCVSALRGR